jgi:hypothetical protein
VRHSRPWNERLGRRPRNETDVGQHRNPTACSSGRAPSCRRSAIASSEPGRSPAKRRGETTWEWLEGGYFLIQRRWTRREGIEQKHLQIIGHDRTPRAEPADAITGRLYTDHGDTVAYRASSTCFTHELPRCPQR